jgi:peptidoglycan/xylan/chitin deacetylase (PgdA/CDA1 family)
VIVIRMEGEEQQLHCRTPGEKSAAYERVYWGLRRLPNEADILAVTDDLAARYGLDMGAKADELCMDWEEIRALAIDPLVTIGAHTVNHVMLGKAADEVARSELKLSREALEAKLGAPVRHLAYPYGGRDLVGTREFRIAADLGYLTAVTTRPGVLFPEHARELMALPRVSLNGLYQGLRHVQVLASGAATAVVNGFRRLDVA